MSVRTDELFDDPAAPAHAPTATPAFPPPGAPDIAIARAAQPQPMLLLAQQRFELSSNALIPYGHYKAKLALEACARPDNTRRGRLVLVTAVTPTAAGEGKTTTSIGLNDGLNRIGVASTLCQREPSIGPSFGMKGGATGGGRAQVIPMEDINLHFNGDFHAIGAAHNLLAAILDNHLHWGNELDIDPRQVSWRRVVDMNDRALRYINVGLGGPAHGLPRESGFDITVASEVMAVLCLADDLTDLERRLARIVVARRRDGSPVSAQDLGVAGALGALLKEALQPNLVQSLENNPVFVHGGPFGNIAHGCSSLIATRSALALSDVTVTEAGFGADLGAEKFIDIKCRQSGLRPDAAVLVCTVRALKLQGGASKTALATPDVAALRAGVPNLERHIMNLKQFGLRPVVAVNRFPSDSAEELAELEAICAGLGSPVVAATHWAEGSDGATALAQAVVEQLDAGEEPAALLYPDSMPLAEKIDTLATRLYGAAGVSMAPPAARQLRDIEQLGYAHLPVCIAKTPYSFSADPALLGAPSGHVLPVREVRLAAGAGFVVAVCGDVMTMPGLPRRPSALDMGLDASGQIYGLS